MALLWLCVISSQIRLSLAAYKSSTRTDWVQVWPGQVVLCGSSVFWTEQVEGAINSNCLQEYFDNVQVGRSTPLFSIIGLQLNPSTKRTV